MSELLWADVTNEVISPIRVSVHVAVEAGDAQYAVRPISPPVLSGVELLLRELGDEESQALNLLGIQNARSGRVVR